MSKNISFVVLHYKVFNVTEKCVNSILKLNNFNHNVSVIIVDNGSNNGTYEKNIDFLTHKGFIESRINSIKRWF